MNTLLQHYAANSRGRDYVVGDIHGQFRLLEALLGHMGFDRERDRLFSVGDLIDRGPESRRVTEFLAAPWFHAILGNHEVMLLEGACTIVQGRRAARDAVLWRRNGGDWFFSLSLREQQAIYDRISQLPVAAEVASCRGSHGGVVHASVDREWSALHARSTDTFRAGEFSRVEDLVWNRDLAHMAVHRALGHAGPDLTIHGIDVVFFGHTPLKAPIRVDNTRWLDTGAAYGNRLSLAELADEGRVWAMAASDQSVIEGWT